jgi:hypothetical protein
MPIPTSFTGGDFEFIMAPSTVLYVIKPRIQEGERVFKFFIILSAAEEGFKFTINLYINFSVKLEAGRDFKLKLLSAKGDFKYITLYIEFPVGELGGYSKEIFKFRMELYAANIPFKDLIFGIG